MKEVEFLNHKFNINDEELDDIDTFEMIVEVQNGNAQHLITLLERIIGADGCRG